MNVSSWLWNWLDARRDAQPSQDPLDHAAKLSLRKLEDRQVLSVSSVFSAGVLDVDLTATDDVAITVNASHEVLVNGVLVDSDNNSGNGTQTLLASQVTSIDIDAAGAFINEINLAGVTTGEFTGLTGSITIDAGDGNDTIIGSAFGDTITGGAGNDSLQGGAGSDIYLFADGFGADTVVDLVGETDTLNFASVTTDIAANLQTHTVTVAMSNAVNFNFTNGSEIDAIIGHAAGNDSLTGLDGISTWTMGATNTYTSGSVTVTFSGFETLQGGKRFRCVPDEFRCDS